MRRVPTRRLVGKVEPLLSPGERYTRLSGDDRKYGTGDTAGNDFLSISRYLVRDAAGPGTPAAADGMHPVVCGSETRTASRMSVMAGETAETMHPGRRFGTSFRHARPDIGRIPQTGTGRWSRIVRGLASHTADPSALRRLTARVSDDART
jgi:hypothetical protein